MASFREIPILSLAAARDATTKPLFLDKLRHTLLEVGFCYLSDTGLPSDLVEKVCQQTLAFFELPLSEKESIEMRNEKSFLGYFRTKCRYSSVSR
jgi:isopenicillin N synthase-like dioxygenase